MFKYTPFIFIRCASAKYCKKTVRKFNFSLLFLFFCLFLSCQNLFGVPIITEISPKIGLAAGGNNVIINGSGFSGSTQVDFGTRSATTFTILNDNKITATVPAGVPGTVNVKITSSGVSAPSPNDFYTYSAIGWKGIISSEDTDQVAIFNTATNTFNDLIPLPNTSLASVITPDGAYIYTANSNSPGFSVIDAATNAIITTVPTSVGVGAFDIVINPSGTKIYISNISSGYVTVVDTITNSVITDIFVQPNIGPLSITPDGSTLFVSCFSSGEVVPINTATNTVGASIATGVYPGKISITPNNQKAFIPVFFNDAILVMNVATQTITNSISLPAGAGPYGSSLLPNGKTLYVVNFNQNTVSVIDVASETLTTTIALPILTMNSIPQRGFPVSNAGSSPFWAAATPDSKTVYLISETNNSVIPIDTLTNTVGNPFDGVTGSFEDLVISPDPAPVASFIVSEQSSAGLPTSFDASSSISPIGSIVLYDWSFGDGTTATTTSPFINHVYAIPGNYIVTLSVTNSAGTSTKKVFSSGFMSNNGGPTAIITHSIQSLQPSPVNLRGVQVKNEFATQVVYTNVIKWNASPFGLKAAYYEIYRDSKTNLTGVVSENSQLIFKDHHLKPNVVYTYYVVAVSSFGNRSDPVVLSINPTNICIHKLK